MIFHFPLDVDRRGVFHLANSNQASWAQQWIATDPDPVSEYPSLGSSPPPFLSPRPTGTLGHVETSLDFISRWLLKMLATSRRLLTIHTPHPPHRMQTAFIVVKQLEQSETNTQTNPTNLQTLAKVKQNSCLNNGKHKPRAIETRIHLVLV